MKLLGHCGTPREVSRWISSQLRTPGYSNGKCLTVLLQSFLLPTLDTPATQCLSAPVNTADRSHILLEYLSSHGTPRSPANASELASKFNAEVGREVRRRIEV